MECRRCKTNFNQEHGNQKFCSANCHRITRLTQNHYWMKNNRWQEKLRLMPEDKRQLVEELYQIIVESGDKNIEKWQRRYNSE